MTGRGAPDAAVRFLGLAARAGAVVPGTERVRTAVRRGEVKYAIVAADASANTMDKLIPLLRARGVPHTVGFSRHELGEAVGRAPLGAVGLTDAALANRVRALAANAPESEA